MDILDLLRHAIEHSASDLHLSAGMPPMIRVDGDISETEYPRLSADILRVLLYKILTPEQQQFYEEALELDFSYEIPHLARFRVNVYHQNRGPAAAFRLIPTLISTLDDLNAPSIFKEIAKLPKGIVLVTGPTGSGKSTTLAALIDYINEHESLHIITIEDPIEFIHDNKKSLINQRELFRDTHGFSTALRSALREDPDVILVGEMRDLETIRLALTAAETGHLVFSTLHTSSAAKTIDRIIDVFPGEEKSMVRGMLSESLKAVVSQTLIKRSAGGRVGAFEIMMCSPAIRNLIREAKIAQMYSAIQTGRSFGMQTLDQHLQELVSKKMIDKTEALTYAENKTLFE